MPNKTPKPKIKRVEPSVLPIPLLIDFMMVFNTIPLAMPTNKLAPINAINAFNFTTVIKSNNKIIDATRMKMDTMLFVIFYKQPIIIALITGFFFNENEQAVFSFKS